MLKNISKVFLVAVFVAMLHGPAYAVGPKFGIKAGVNLADQSVSAEGLSVDLSSKTGIIGGAFVAFSAGPRLSIQPELLFSQKGSKLSLFGSEAKTKMDYLEIPVLLKLKLGLPTAPTAPFLFAGPSFGILASAKQEALGMEEEDVKDAFKSTDVGLAFGAGLDAGKITLDARYTLGVTDIDEASGVSTKNNTITLMVGYYLN